MRADDHYEHQDSQGRPTLRKKALSTITADWAAEHGVKHHPYAKAAYLAAEAMNSRKSPPSAAQKASLLSEWRRCMEALESELVEVNPMVTAAMANVGEIMAGEYNPSPEGVAVLDLILRPGSPWRS